MDFLFMLRCFGRWLDSEIGMPCAIFIIFYYFFIIFLHKIQKTFSLYPPATSKVPTTGTTSYSGFWFMVWLPSIMGFLFLFDSSRYTVFLC